MHGSMKASPRTPSNLRFGIHGNQIIASLSLLIFRPCHFQQPRISFEYFSTKAAVAVTKLSTSASPSLIFRAIKPRSAR